jgi:hypothetical protein
VRTVVDYLGRRYAREHPWRLDDDADAERPAQ